MSISMSTSIQTSGTDLAVDSSVTPVVAGVNAEDVYDNHDATTPETAAFEEHAAMGTIPSKAASYEPAKIRAFQGIMDTSGQDTNSTISISLGTVKRDTYLALPKGWSRPTVAAGLVGTKNIAISFTINDFAQIYALNKDRCSSTAADDRQLQALLRAEAVTAGYVDVVNQNEIVFLDGIPDDDALAVLGADIAQILPLVETAKVAGFLVPLVAEFVFRTTGHQFLSGDTANYVTRYQKMFNSCLTPEVGKFMSPIHLFQEALHWVTPRRARTVIAAQLALSTIPDSLRIRFDAAPAGTAIVTTTKAVLDAMDGNLREELMVAGNYDFAKIESVCMKIKQNPIRYHKLAFAYGQTFVNGPDLEEFKAATEVGVKFAPVAQAFINVFLQNSELSEAKVLRKYAAENPVMGKRAESLFRGIGKTVRTEQLGLIWVA